MIKFKIFKGEKDESEIVFIQKDSKEKEKLIFEVIKNHAVEFLIKSINNEDRTFEIEIADSSLESYRQIVKTIFESVMNDEELKELYKEKSELKEKLE